MAMHSELAGHAAVGAAAYTRTMPVTDAPGRICWPVPHCEDRLRGKGVRQAGFIGVTVLVSGVRAALGTSWFWRNTAAGLARLVHHRS